jgi:hypothetical protein
LEKWRSRPESNRDTRIRNPLLYPFELREQSSKTVNFNDDLNKTRNRLKLNRIDFLHFSAGRYYNKCLWQIQKFRAQQFPRNPILNGLVNVFIVILPIMFTTRLSKSEGNSIANP